MPDDDPNRPAVVIWQKMRLSRVLTNQAHDDMFFPGRTLPELKKKKHPGQSIFLINIVFLGLPVESFSEMQQKQELKLLESEQLENSEFGWRFGRDIAPRHGLAQPGNRCLQAIS